MVIVIKGLVYGQMQYVKETQVDIRVQNFQTKTKSQRARISYARSISCILTWTVCGLCCSLLANKPFCASTIQQTAVEKVSYRTEQSEVRTQLLRQWVLNRDLHCFPTKPVSQSLYWKALCALASYGLRAEFTNHVLQLKKLVQGFWSVETSKKSLIQVQFIFCSQVQTQVDRL